MKEFNDTEITLKLTRRELLIVSMLIKDDTFRLLEMKKHSTTGKNRNFLRLFNELCLEYDNILLKIDMANVSSFFEQELSDYEN